MTKQIEIFGLTNGKKLATKLCKLLNKEEGKIKIQHFKDGEILVKPLNSVRGKDVIIIQSTSTPVNDSLMELLIAIDAMRRASAKTISVIIPYMGYSRQDRKTKPREPITFKLVANLLEVAGAQNVLTWDIHSKDTHGFFDIHFDSAQAIWDMLNKFFNDKHPTNLTIVAPDYGGVKLSRTIALELGLDLAIIDKRRPVANEVEINDVLGSVENKNCLMIDDMIDTGGTIIKGAGLLKQKGAKTVSIFATHALFNGDAIKNLKEAKESGIIDNIYITDTIQRTDEQLKEIDFIKIVSVAPQLSKVFNVFSKGCGSLSEVIKEPLQALKEELNKK